MFGKVMDDFAAIADEFLQSFLEISWKMKFAQCLPHAGTESHARALE
jgi:hypothetical protein